ncbi:hypothetical protein OROGR_011340 [Orobanche gracilis]
MESATVLACTDLCDFPVNPLVDAMNEFGSQGHKWNPLIVSNAAKRDKFPLESCSVDLVILIWQSPDSSLNNIIREIRRVLKRGGTAHIRNTFHSAVGSVDKIMSTLKHFLRMAKFQEIQSTVNKSYGVNARRPLRQLDSSSALKKLVKSSPKGKIDVDSDLKN